MTPYKFQPLTLTFAILLIVLGILFASTSTDVLAQLPTETPASTAGLFITVVTNEPQINVRMGPSSTVYPVVGFLLTGSTAPALGRSQGGDWVQIEFPSAPGGKGWVYSPLVQVSPPGNLQVVEAPPTPVPPATSTIDPTLAAQFLTVPTTTRLPTYTPPPTLTGFDFEREEVVSYRIPWATIIVVLTISGLIGFLLSLIQRRK